MPACHGGLASGHVLRRPACPAKTRGRRGGRPWRRVDGYQMWRGMVRRQPAGLRVGGGGRAGRAPYGPGWVTSHESGSPSASRAAAAAGASASQARGRGRVGAAGPAGQKTEHDREQQAPREGEAHGAMVGRGAERVNSRLTRAPASASAFPVRRAWLLPSVVALSALFGPGAGCGEVVVDGGACITWLDGGPVAMKVRFARVRGNSRGAGRPGGPHGMYSVRYVCVGDSGGSCPAPAAARSLLASAWARHPRRRGLRSPLSGACTTTQMVGVRPGCHGRGRLLLLHVRGREHRALVTTLSRCRSRWA